MFENYAPNIFDVKDLKEAKHVALSKNDKLSTDDRDKLETKFILDVMSKCDFDTSGYILDYGCGYGRLAKELITKGCKVIGVDISESMRKQAREYVGDVTNFICVSPDTFADMINAGFRCSAAYSIWCLQHVNNPEIDIKNISLSLKNITKFLILNAKYERFVPVTVKEKDENGKEVDSLKFQDDHVNIFDILNNHFIPGTCFTYPAELGYQVDLVSCRVYMKGR